jgi:monoterpene epsilon-lactone hydrolase
MSLSRLVARALLRVLSRRRRHGPKRPAWPLPVEVANELMRLHLENSTSQHPRAIRALQERMGRAMPSLALLRAARRVDQLGGVEGTWLTPRDRQPDEVLLYLHGGGYCMGSMGTHGDLVATIMLAAGVRTFTPHYRLAPEHPYPAALEDVFTAYRALLDAGTAPQRLVVGGDSAGGGLTLALLLRLRETGLPMPAGALLISPWVDLTCSLPSVSSNVPYDFGDATLLRYWADMYRGEASASDPLISPLYAELRGLPPLCIFAGELELFMDEARALYEKARAASVDAELICAPDMVHDYPMMHMMSQPAKEAIHHAGRFIQDVCARAS